MKTQNKIDAFTILQSLTSCQEKGLIKHQIIPTSFNANKGMGLGFMKGQNLKVVDFEPGEKHHTIIQGDRMTIKGCDYKNAITSIINFLKV